MTFENLSAAMVAAKPQDYDFRQGCGEKWDVVRLEGVYCCSCAEPYPDKEEGDECPKCGESLQEYDVVEAGDEPMMNRRYPIEFPYDVDIGEAALALARAHVALCLVDFFEEEGYYLALTGVGMDFSWDICQAYIALGCLPPVHFCNLPNFAGTDYGEPEVRRTLEACLHSCEVLTRWTEDTAEKLREKLVWGFARGFRGRTGD